MTPDELAEQVLDEFHATGPWIVQLGMDSKQHYVVKITGARHWSGTIDERMLKQLMLGVVAAKTRIREHFPEGSKKYLCLERLQDARTHLTLALKYLSEAIAEGPVDVEDEAGKC